MRTIIVTALLLLSTLTLLAQKKGPDYNPDEVLMTIAGEPVTLGEFAAIFKKNNQDARITRESLDSYMDLFTVFKLKVREARDLGMDTSRVFAMELASYVKQLSGPYLRDTASENRLVRQAYQRMQTDRNVSQILIRVDRCASPADTMKAFNRIRKIRDDLIKNPRTFEEVARRVSEDSLSGVRGGLLGWLTAPNMALPFENAVYETQVGSISQIVRTSLGYHIVRVNQERPAKGRVKVAHIYISADMNDPASRKMAEARVAEAQLAIKKGEIWGGVVRYFSENHNTASKNGELPAFGINTYDSKIEEVVFNMKTEGEISEPVEVENGFHIFKLVEKPGIPAFSDFRNELQRQLSKTSRWDIPRDAFLESLKKEYEFNLNRAELSKVVSAAGNDGLILRSSLSGPGDTRLFSFTGGTRTFADFFRYVEGKVQSNQLITTCNFESEILAGFIYQELLAVKEERLPAENPQFRYLVNEYREGILLFALMDQNVWKRSVRDTSGLVEFHTRNRENYMWGPRVRAYIVDCKNDVVEAAARKLAPRLLSGKLSKDKFVAALNKKAADNVIVLHNIYSPGENKIVDLVSDGTGISETVREGNKIRFAVVYERLAPMPKELNECRGIATSDFSNYLEQQWVSSLREKYPVQINRQILYRLAD
jgi:peptidyl-prolyl cis-trans isomerase SurA